MRVNRESEIRQNILNSFQKAYDEGIYAQTPKNIKLGIAGQPYRKSEKPSDKQTEKIHALVKEKEQEILDLTQQKYEACSIIGKDGNHTFSKSGEKSSVSFTNEEIEFLKGAKVFTHNHPSSRCFSFEDLAMTMKHGIVEMRAIAPESVKGNVTWKFINKGMPSDIGSIKEFKEIWNYIEEKTRNYFGDKISSAKGKLEKENVIKEANQTHHYKLLVDLKQYLESPEGQKNYSYLNKFEFTYEQR